MQRIKLEGTTIGDLYIKEYLGNKKYLTVCTKCGAEKVKQSGNLVKGWGTTCDADKPNMQDLVGTKVYEWEVLKYLGDKKYLCRCSCGKEKEVFRYNLIRGNSKSCGHWHRTFGDLTGRVFGEWTVLRKAGYNYECRCSCGKIAIKTSSDLTSGKSKSCGHGYNTFTDISGQVFGLWKVLGYLGNQHYLCECSCENRTRASIRKADLLSGATKSCGCASKKMAARTLMERYGEIGPNKVSNPRSQEQVQAVLNAESLSNFIDRLNDSKLTPIKLAKHLGLQLSRTLVLLHEFGLEDKVRIYSSLSSPENDLLEYVRSIYNGHIIENDRLVLSGKELDIYLPDKKLAIEFDGSYWHSSVFKEKDYHFKKSVACGKVGINLIHIFEYEWNDPIQRSKLEIFLADRLNQHKEIYARNLDVQEIDADKARVFLNANHLQGYTNSKVSLGLVNKSTQELLGVMTFGAPRFTSDAEYELIRLCYLPNLTIVGGTQRLFSYFLRTYKPKSIVTYADLAKFTGNIYLSLGFKLVNGANVTPNYVWFSTSDGKVMSRYQSQKHKLLAAGLGKYGSTEDEIMQNTGHLKIYDAGQLKFMWKSGGEA